MRTSLILVVLSGAGTISVLLRLFGLVSWPWILAFLPWLLMALVTLACMAKGQAAASRSTRQDRADTPFQPASRRVQAPDERHTRRALAFDLGIDPADPRRASRKA